MNYILGILDAYNDMSKREFFHEDPQQKLALLEFSKLQSQLEEYQKSRKTQSLSLFRVRYPMEIVYR